MDNNSDKTPKNYTELSQNMVNSDNNTDNKNTSLITQNTPDKDLFIRKKRVYNRFINLIKKGQFTSAVLTAKALKIDRHTLYKWLNTKKAIEAGAQELNNYINNIKDNKDWKAQAYLLDKIVTEDKTEDKQIDLTNLIQINIHNTPNTNKIDSSF